MSTSVCHRTADVTPTETPKKSERVKLKNDPKGSRVHKSPQGSAGEGSSEPSSSKSKQSAQQAMKPESEDSSSSSSWAVAVSPQMRRRSLQRKR